VGNFRHANIDTNQQETTIISEKHTTTASVLLAFKIHHLK